MKVLQAFIRGSLSYNSVARVLSCNYRGMNTLVRRTFTRSGGGVKLHSLARVHKERVILSSQGHINFYDIVTCKDSVFCSVIGTLNFLMSPKLSHVHQTLSKQLWSTGLGTNVGGLRGKSPHTPDNASNQFLHSGGKRKCKLNRPSKRTQPYN